MSMYGCWSREGSRTAYHRCSQQNWSWTEDEEGRKSAQKSARNLTEKKSPDREVRRLLWGGHFDPTRPGAPLRRSSAQPLQPTAEHISEQWYVMDVSWFAGPRQEDEEVVKLASREILFVFFAH